MSRQLTSGVIGRRKAAGGLLLDIYPTTGFAYSISRELVSLQNKIITAVKAGNVFQDFSIFEILNGDLEAFSDGGDVRMKKWNSVQGNVYNNTTSNINFGTGNPVLVDSGVLMTTNGIAEIRFNETSQHVSDTSSESFSEDDFTWYSVFKSQSTISPQVPISECVPTTLFNGSSILSDTRSNGVKYNYRPQNTSFIIEEANTTIINTVYIYTTRRTGNIIEHFVNGVKTGKVTVSGGFLDPTALRLGTRGGNANPFLGAFNETIMYPESQSDTVMNNIIQNQMDYYL